jgi:nicotinate-nucleotide adenylyltransferase
MAAAIGIFGGTFDPVHYGHLRAALEARELLGLEDFRLLPAGTPPHREGTMASSQDRLNMVKLAVADYPEFRVDDREVQREGRSFMADTLAGIRAESGNTPILLIIGQDAANELDSMRRPGARSSWSGELRDRMEDCLVKQSGQLHTTPSGLVLPLQITQLAISSTDIRQRLREGRSARFLMPDSVIDYIEQNQLYFAGQVRKG